MHQAARNYGAEVVVDMIQVPDVVAAPSRWRFGADYVGIWPSTSRCRARPLGLREVAQAVSIPIAVASGINSRRRPWLSKQAPSL
jgi:3-keto-L-gulonate-6-phosphate decarboxylase